MSEATNLPCFRPQPDLSVPGTYRTLYLRADRSLASRSVICVNGEFTRARHHDVSLARGTVLGPPLVYCGEVAELSWLWWNVAREYSIRVFGQGADVVPGTGGLWPVFRLGGAFRLFTREGREAAISNLVRRASLGERLRLVYGMGEDAWHGEAVRSVVLARLGSERARLTVRDVTLGGIVSMDPPSIPKLRDVRCSFPTDPPRVPGWKDLL